MMHITTSKMDKFFLLLIFIHVNYATTFSFKDLFLRKFDWNCTCIPSSKCGNGNKKMGLFGAVLFPKENPNWNCPPLQICCFPENIKLVNDSSNKHITKQPKVIKNQSETGKVNHLNVDAFKSNITSTKHEWNCTCVPNHQCRNGNKKVGMPKSIFVPKNNPNWKCPSREVCCFPENIILVGNSSNQATPIQQTVVIINNNITIHNININVFDKTKTENSEDHHLNSHGGHARAHWNCSCIPTHQCGNGNKKVGPPGALLFPEYNPKWNCESLEICCFPENVKSKQNSSNQDDLVDQIATKNQTDLSVSNPESPCGYRNIKPNENVQTSRFNMSASAFPWSVIIYFINFEEKSEKACHGTLLNRYIVLTLAHCVSGKKPSRFTVVGGKWTEAINETLYLQYRQIQNIVVHPDYISGSYLNDMALLELSVPFNFEDNINAICFTPMDFDFNKCIAPGYNVDQSGKQVINLITQTVIDDEECKSALDKSAVGEEFLLDEELMCTKKAEEKTSCVTDTGSSLVCPLVSDPSRYTQVGILLWNVQCNSQDVSGIYIDIIENREWIQKFLTNFNNDQLNKARKGNETSKASFEQKPLYSKDQNRGNYYKYTPTQVTSSSNNQYPWSQNQENLQLNNQEYKPVEFSTLYENNNRFQTADGVYASSDFNPWLHDQPSVQPSDGVYTSVDLNQLLQNQPSLQPGESVYTSTDYGTWLQNRQQSKHDFYDFTGTHHVWA